MKFKHFIIFACILTVINIICLGVVTCYCADNPNESYNPYDVYNGSISFVAPGGSYYRLNGSSVSCSDKNIRISFSYSIIGDSYDVVRFEGSSPVFVCDTSSLHSYSDSNYVLGNITLFVDDIPISGSPVFYLGSITNLDLVNSMNIKSNVSYTVKYGSSFTGYSYIYNFIFNDITNSFDNIIDFNSFAKFYFVKNTYPAPILKYVSSDVIAKNGSEQYDMNVLRFHFAYSLEHKPSGIRLDSISYKIDSDFYEMHHNDYYMVEHMPKIPIDNVLAYNVDDEGYIMSYNDPLKVGDKGTATISINMNNLINYISTSPTLKFEYIIIQAHYKYSFLKDSPSATFLYYPSTGDIVEYKAYDIDMSLYQGDNPLYTLNDNKLVSVEGSQGIVSELFVGGDKPIDVSKGSINEYLESKEEAANSPDSSSVFSTLTDILNSAKFGLSFVSNLFGNLFQNPIFCSILIFGIAACVFLKILK